MIRPQKEDFLKIAKKDSVVAVVAELPSDLITPVDAYYATNASYILESAEGGSAVGRYSFLGIDPVVRLSINKDDCTVSENGDTKSFKMQDPVRMIGEILKSREFIGQGDLSPFPGGAVGFIGYEYVHRWEKVGNTKKEGLALPESVFFITRYNLVFDNLMHTLKIVANVRTTEDFEKDYNEAVAGINKIKIALEAIKDRIDISDMPAAGELVSSYSKEDFEKHVDRIKELITEGEAIQVVLSRRMSADYEGDPFLIFRALRTINPSPYMFYLDFDDFVILGASPEVMVKVDNGKTIVRPIAGTRPRGKTNEEDEALKRDLLSDEKELAEHIMLVDLGRNDLGRIAVPGTVNVDKMMVIERYSHVMHIVSEVSANLRDEFDTFDVIKATFPAGTLSGAPKVRAMEIIDELEPVGRGPYGGLIGYMSYTGGFDSCITIRSMVVKDKKVHLQAGAGIVYDSVPEKEYDETTNKAMALFKALEKGGN